MDYNMPTYLILSADDLAHDTEDDLYNEVLPHDISRSNAGTVRETNKFVLQVNNVTGATTPDYVQPSTECETSKLVLHVDDFMGASTSVNYAEPREPPDTPITPCSSITDTDPEPEFTSLVAHTYAASSRKRQSPEERKANKRMRAQAWRDRKKKENDANKKNLEELQQENIALKSKEKKLVQENNSLKLALLGKSKIINSKERAVISLQGKIETLEKELAARPKREEQYNGESFLKTVDAGLNLAVPSVPTKIKETDNDNTGNLPPDLFDLDFNNMSLTKNGLVEVLSAYMESKGDKKRFHELTGYKQNL